MNLYIVLILIFNSYRFSESLHCYSCQNVTEILNCINVAQCTNGQQCGASSAGVVNLVGRATDQQHCLECCSTDNCNINLCVHLKPSTCVDDVKVDCAYMNTVFNFCTDINHAKIACPKFCGLCTLVDGSWSDWSVWSQCDVTCENGSRSRVRTCSNPAPQNGGLDCQGSSTETRTCTAKELCPVDGGWSGWASWEPCSVSCDYGLQKRHRTCSNPAPARFGDHCYGESMDVRICKIKSCQINYATLQDVAFFSYKLENVSFHDNRRVQLVFKELLFNEGHSYNSSTGLFVAPVDGIYHFNTEVYTGQPDLVVTILKNGQAIGFGVPFFTGLGYIATAEATVLLSAQSEVYVECELIKTYEFDLRSDAPDEFDKFEGFLVH